VRRTSNSDDDHGGGHSRIGDSEGEGPLTRKLRYHKIIIMTDATSMAAYSARCC
jgi:hypothetical protein